MRLILEQKTWNEIDSAAAAGVALPHIVILPSVPFDEDRAQRKNEYVEWNLPPGTSVSIVAEEAALSSVQWPLKIVEARVMKSNDVIEARVVAIYGILEYLAAAMWRGPLAALEANREKILKALKGGRPNWRSNEVIALAQLYE